MDSKSPKQEEEMTKKSGRKISTAISDLVLAISAFYVSYNWFNKGFIKAGFGLTIQGAAASVGVIKFSMENPEGTAVFYAWRFLAFMAQVFGVPLIAIEFCLLHGSSVLGNKITMFVVAVVLVSSFLPKKTRDIASQAVSGFAVLTIIILCFVRQNWFGMSAGVSYVIAGLIFGMEGKFLGIPNVDSLHYFLAIANIMFGLALQ